MNAPKLILVRPNDRPGRHPFLNESNVSGCYPPLGLAYLAASVRQAGFPVEIIDASALNLTNNELVQQVVRSGAQAIGMSSTTFNWPIVSNAARLLRQACPEAVIIIGGPQLSLYPDQCLENHAIDIAVIDEGDETIVEIMRNLADDKEFVGLPGTLVRKDGELHQGPSRSPIEDLDSLPLPALDLLPLKRYRALTIPSPFVSIVTSRGCPFKCRYCSQAYVGGSYREHGAKRVVEEMERTVIELGARELIFFDESFSVSRKRILQVCELVEQKRLKTRWNIRTRADCLDPETMQALHRAGCYGIHVGIESGSPRIQKLMNKNLDLDRVKILLQDARTVGLETRGYFMIGYPTETITEIEQTISLALNTPLDWASFSITTPNPGTVIYRDLLNSGQLKSDYWSEYTLGLTNQALGYFTSNKITEELLERSLKRAYRKFYLRPGQIIRKAFSARLWRTLPGTLRMLLELVAAKAVHNRKD